MISLLDLRGDDNSVMNDSVLVGFLPKGISTDASIHDTLMINSLILGFTSYSLFLHVLLFSCMVLQLLLHMLTYHSLY